MAVLREQLSGEAETMIYCNTLAIPRHMEAKSWEEVLQIALRRMEADEGHEILSVSPQYQPGRNSSIEVLVVSRRVV